MRNQLSATIVLIMINAVVFIAETTAGGSTNTDVAIRFGAQYTPLIQQGQWWRLFTSMFLHFGIMHIATNMYALYSLGTSVERMFGHGRFLIIYLVSGFCGNLLSYLIERQTHHYAVSAGASGAIFGLMGVFLMMALMPRWRSYVPVRSVLINLGINLAVGFSNRQINMNAHLGGLIGGMLCTLVMLTIL